MNLKSGIRNPSAQAPRAFRLDPDLTTPSDQRVAIIPEPDAAESVSEIVTPRARGVRWVHALVTALAGLAGVSVFLWAQNAVIAAIRQSDALGLIAVALAGIIVIAAVVLSWRFMRDLLRERRIERLKLDAAQVLVTRSSEDARRVVAALAELQAARPQTATGRARFAAALPQMSDAGDIMALAERELLEPLDRLAADEISRAARQVSVVTAVSPRALIDLVFVVFAGARLLRAITAIYGGRPGLFGLLRVARASVSHLLVTGGLAAGDAVIQQLVGQGLAARLSAKLGEGVLNGLMTARFGLAALSVCRPMPFVETRPPTLSDVASGLMSSAKDEPKPG